MSPPALNLTVPSTLEVETLFNVTVTSLPASVFPTLIGVTVTMGANLKSVEKSYEITKYHKVAVSIDTSKWQVAEEALAAGAIIINDVTGFKNRSTFYTAFKEITKMTPVEWIKQNCDFILEED